MAKYRGKVEKNRQNNERINGEITARDVRVIDHQGNQLGVLNVREAMSRAMEVELDLVEVSPNAVPPVCKILDYGKYKFQQQKKAAEARKNQVKVTVKEIAIRPQTEEHDYQIKLRKTREFLERGDKVRVNLRFRGREITHQDLGLKVLERIAADTADIAKVDQMPKMEGRVMILLLSPQASKK